MWKECREDTSRPAIVRKSPFAVLMSEIFVPPYNGKFVINLSEV